MFILLKALMEFAQLLIVYKKLPKWWELVEYLPVKPFPFISGVYVKYANGKSWIRLLYEACYEIYNLIQRRSSSLRKPKVHWLWIAW